MRRVLAVRLLATLLGIGIMVTLVGAAFAQAPASDASHFVNPWLVVGVSACGLLGGLLSVLRTGTIRPIRRTENGMDVGWVGDLAFGLAGGLVVLFLTPGTFATSGDILRLLGLCLLGGYCGRALVEQSAGRVLQRTTEHIDGRLKEQADKIEKLPQAVQKILRSELTRPAFVDEVRRVVNKQAEERQAPQLCLIYADVDGLKSHTRSAHKDGRTKDAESLRLSILACLRDTLVEASNARGKAWDAFSLREPDEVVVIRSANREEAKDIAEMARQEFTAATEGNGDLCVTSGKSLSATFAVVPVDSSFGSVAEVDKLHDDIIRFLAKAKQESRGGVSVYS